MPALWGAHLRGLQGVLQEDRAEERQVRLPGGQELPGGQAEEKSLPVLSVPEVPGLRDGEGGGEDGQPERKERKTSNETKEQPGGASSTSSCPHHGSRQGARGVDTQVGESRLLAGIDSGGDVLARASPLRCTMHQSSPTLDESQPIIAV